MRLLPLLRAAAASAGIVGANTVNTFDTVSSDLHSQELSPLVPRKLSDFHLARFVLLATLDGALEARDRTTGSLIWSSVSEPLVQVEQITGDHDGVDAVWVTEYTESGRLHYFDPEGGLEQISASIKDLVEKTPLAYPGTVVYTGSKSTTFYAIDAETGEIFHSYGGTSPLVFSERHKAEEDLIHLGRREYTLEIHERVSARAWKLKFATWEPNLRDMDLQQQYESPLDGMHVLPISNTTVLSVTENVAGNHAAGHQRRWIREVGNVVKVFDVVSNGSYVVLPQPQLQLPDTNKEGALYVDTTANGDFYALGQEYQALLVAAKNSPWCVGARTFRSRQELTSLLTGLHPSWCRGPSEPQIELPGPTDYPQLPPAQQSVSRSIFSRVLEEIFRFIVLGIFLLIAARQDWFPELFSSLADFFRRKAQENSPPTSTSVTTVVPPTAVPADTEEKALPSSPEEEKPKRKRGKRGGKKVREAKRRAEGEDGESLGPLFVSNEILGYGSHGTTVVRGKFQNREVAIKRMLLSFYETANREIQILQESDDHQNVVRYFCKHETDQFLYIALELCSGTIEDLLNPSNKKCEKNQNNLETLQKQLEPLVALQQIVEGVHYLHSLKIVHRDIKPQNILVANPKIIHMRDANNNKVSTLGPVRLLISDFGLCKKLDSDQSSFHNTTATGAGTSGWTAPEISMGSRYVAQTGIKEYSSDVIIEGNQNRRLTRAVDIFSLGCVFYYVLTPGLHPFGEGYMRQPNIENQTYNLEGLQYLPFAQEATDLIKSMIAFNPLDRPETGEIMIHPLFWSDRQKLDLLVKVSDRLEHDTREEHSDLLMDLEKHAPLVVGADWHTKFPTLFIENLGKYRKYHGDRIIDLLRALRNKLNHYNDFSEELKQCVGPIPSGYLHFYTSKFPDLFMVVYHYSKTHFANEDVFRPYFEVKL